VFVLGYVGGAEANPFNVMLGQAATAYYFLHFLVILPYVSRAERPREIPNSITEAVLAKHAGTSPAKTAMAG
jgi:ubiquinol-cytochrome c reductase cytochrome b subunit